MFDPYWPRSVKETLEMIKTSRNYVYTQHKK